MAAAVSGVGAAGLGAAHPAACYAGHGRFGLCALRSKLLYHAAAAVSYTHLSAVKPAASGSKHYEPGDIVEHKVFGRGTVLKVKPAAGDQIVEINFEKVGIKKTMANFAPLTKITEEE